MIKIGPITLYTELEQGSDEWHLLRAGSLGSSEFAIAAATGRAGKESKTRTALIEAKVIAEAAGTIQQGYSSEWMDRGHQLESMAAQWAEKELRRIYAQAGVELLGLSTVGMVQHDDFAGLHSSPDRLVDIGLWPMPVVEIKCPKPSTHLKYLSDWVKHGPNWIPAEYRWQLDVHRVICSEMCWFCSFDPECKAQVLSWLPPPDVEVKQRVNDVLERWRIDLKEKKNNAETLLIRISEDEREKEVETAALIFAAQKKLMEIVI